MDFGFIERLLLPINRDKIINPKSKIIRRVEQWIGFFTL